MLLTGFVVLAFVVYHLLHFTLGVTDPSDFARRTPDGRHDVHAMVVLGFRRWPVVLAYVVAQVALAFHLAHGTSSAFQTLGVTHPRLAWTKSRLGPAVAAVVLAGNVSIPVAVLAGWVGLPAGGPS
jgi:succinate dehydrogenase / fumarate reductase cytochrome b subunit